LWLNEIIQPPPEPEANRWIQVARWQVRLCEGDTCAAAILAYFFARHYGKSKHASEGHEDNQIAAAHGLKPRRAAESLWFRATDAQIEEAIFFYKRRSFAKSIALLETLGFISILKKNPNPAFPGDNSRYFRLNADEIQTRLRKLYDYKAPVNSSKEPPGKNADTPSGGKKGVGKNADTRGKIAEGVGKTARHSNKEDKEGSKGRRESDDSPGVDSKDESTPGKLGEEKLRLKGILEGVEPFPEGVEPDEALLELLPVALECSRAAQGLFAFTFWKFHRKHPRAIFDARRKRAADDRLKAGFTLDRLILAIRGIKFSSHHMGMNPKTNPDANVYDDFGLILRDAKQVETFEALALASDEADRRRAVEASLTEAKAPVPDSRFSEGEIDSFGKTVADLLSEGYEVSHLRAKFNVGKALALPDWTRILERASAIKAERDSPSLNGNGAAREAVKGSDSPEWSEASTAARESGAGPRAMPHAQEEDFE
jgi:hypothetical protein